MLCPPSIPAVSPSCLDHVEGLRHHRLHSFLDLSLGASTDVKARPSAFHSCHRDCTALFPECRCWDSSLRFSFSPTFSFSVFGNTRLLAISPGFMQNLQQSSNVTFADTIASGISIHVRGFPHGGNVVTPWPESCPKHLPPSTDSLRKSALDSQGSAQKSNGCLLSGGSESSFLDHCTEGTCE